MAATSRAVEGANASKGAGLPGQPQEMFKPAGAPALCAKIHNNLVGLAR
jgi:hypothetical protein